MGCKEEDGIIYHGTKELKKGRQNGRGRSGVEVRFWLKLPCSVKFPPSFLFGREGGGEVRREVYITQGYCLCESVTPSQFRVQWNKMT